MHLPCYEEFINDELSDTQISVLEELFEPSYSIIRFTLKNKVFMQLAQKEAVSYAEFIELIRSHLLQVTHQAEAIGPSSRDVDHLAEIVSAHPRLGDPPKRLSAHSKEEQKNLNNSKDSPEVRRKLVELNKAYEETYPGLLFVAFVNGRSRPEILKVMEQRIGSGNSWFREVEIAINELCAIALDRIKKWETKELTSKY